MQTANFLENKMLRRSLILLLIIAIISFAAYKMEITLTGTPSGTIVNVGSIGGKKITCLVSWLIAQTI